MSDAPTSPVNRTASTTTGFFRYLVIRRLPLVPVRFIKGVRVRARLPLLPRGLAHLLREAQLAEDCPALLTHGPPAATATEGGLRPELRLADVHQRRIVRLYGHTEAVAAAHDSGPVAVLEPEPDGGAVKVEFILEGGVFGHGRQFHTASFPLTSGR